MTTNPAKRHQIDHTQDFQPTFAIPQTLADPTAFLRPINVLSPVFPDSMGFDDKLNPFAKTHATAFQDGVFHEIRTSDATDEPF